MSGFMDWIFLAALSMLPFWEGRYTIPAAIAYGFDPLAAYLWCAAFNILACPLIFFALSVLYTKWLCNIDVIRRVYEACVRKVSSKDSRVLERWQELGLLVFVAIPVPVTGVWTATLLAWLFQLDMRKSVLVISIGVLIACTLTTLATIGVLSIQL